MSRRLFHAIVLVGTAMGTGCSSGDESASSAVDAPAEAADTWPTIFYDTSTPDMGDTSVVVDATDSASDTLADAGTADAADASDTTDTWPGIMPAMTDAFAPIK